MVTDEKDIPGGGQEMPQGSAAPPRGAKPAKAKKGGGFPKWAIWIIVVVVIAVIAGIAVGVVMALVGGEENQSPAISSLTANPPSVNAGQSSTITCVASDPDGDTLDYDWDYTGGELQGAGTTRTWIAPAVGGTFSITVTVDDGNGGTDEDSVAIVVGIAPTPTPTPTSTPAPSDGSIDIQSNPAGASIYIDGVDTGSITPYVAMHIPEGNHIIRMEYPYYEWHIGTVTVVGGETAYINWALDPSTIQTATIQPDAAAGKDAYVYELSPGANWGTGSYIFTSGDAVGSLLRMYVQFDLSSIPSSAVITDAKLGLSYETQSGGAVAGPVGVYRVVAPWDEATITWDTQPAVAASVMGTTNLPAAATSAFIYWDIDDLVQGWISGLFANRGMTLKDTDEATFEGYKGFYSSDFGTLADTPKLTIQYYDPAP